MANMIKAWLECIRCNKKYDLEKIRYSCDCGGTLDMRRDLSAVDGQKLKQLWEERWGRNGEFMLPASGVTRNLFLTVKTIISLPVRKAAPVCTTPAKPGNTPE